MSSAERRDWTGWRRRLQRFIYRLPVTYFLTMTHLQPTESVTSPSHQLYVTDMNTHTHTQQVRSRTSPSHSLNKNTVLTVTEDKLHVKRYDWQDFILLLPSSIHKLYLVTVEDLSQTKTLRTIKLTCWFNIRADQYVHHVTVCTSLI